MSSFSRFRKLRLLSFLGLVVLSTLLAPNTPVAHAQDAQPSGQIERYVGISLIDGVDAGACNVDIARDTNDGIMHISVSGTAKRVSYGERPSTSSAATYIEVGKLVTAEELHSFVSFTAMPSLAHPSYRRIGLQIVTGTWDHPWPGLQEVSYVVEKSDYLQIIARTNLYLILRLIPLGHDEIRCENLRRQT